MRKLLDKIAWNLGYVPRTKFKRVVDGRIRPIEMHRDAYKKRWQTARATAKKERANRRDIERLLGTAGISATTD